MVPLSLFGRQHSAWGALKPLQPGVASDPQIPHGWPLPENIFKGLLET